MHIRWPRLLRSGRTRSTREGFALAPVVALRPALDIGLQGDRYIQRWFSGGAQSKLHINVATPPHVAQLNTKQRQELVDYVKLAVRSREPLVTFDTTSNTIQDTPQDRQAKELRQFQVQEISRVYGIPSPLINVDITNWGSGIEQLAKLFFRFGLRQHLDRVLAPLQVRLLAPGDRFWVDTSDLLWGDADAIGTLLTALQGDAQHAPIATREELRHLAGLPRDVDGNFETPLLPGAPSSTGVAAALEGGTAMTASAFQAARHELGLTIEALAERLGVDPRTVRRWQSGEREIPGPVVTALGLLLRART